MTVGGIQQETSHNGVVMYKAKGMGPDAIRRQAWSWGDARYISRHGPRGNAKGGNGRHKGVVWQSGAIMVEQGQRWKRVQCQRQRGKGCMMLSYKRVWL